VSFDIGPGDEELLEPARDPDRDQARRLRMLLTLAVALLIGVLLLGRALSTDAAHDAAEPTPRPTPMATDVAEPAGPDALTREAPRPVPSPSWSTRTLPNGRVTKVAALPRRTAPDPTACPDASSCYATDVQGTNVRAMVRAVFPTARVRTDATIRLVSSPWVGELWFRQIVAVVDGAEIVLRVQRAMPSDVYGSGTTGDGVNYYSVRIGEYYIAAQIDAGGTGSVAKLRQLTHDRRVLTP